MSLKFLFLFSLLSLALSHSYLTVPPPYTVECKGCSICPSERKNPKMIHHTRNNPVAVWSRGQKVNIKWVKNNHNGGFVRLSLLPVSGTFNATALTHFAFYYGCWEQGRYKCHGRECGLDTHGEAFHRLVTIPDNLPDGVYTFAYMWYGGTHFKRKKGKYSDFTSCSYVRIRGGTELKNVYQPFFEPGNLDKYEHNGLCLTSSNAPGQCLDGCDFKPTFYDIPKEFKRGRPGSIGAWEYGKGMPSTGGGNVKPQDDEDDEGVPALPKDFIPGQDYNKYVNGTKKKEAEKKGSSGDGEGKKNENIKRTSSFICNHSIGICCPSKCGECEQNQCNNRNGGRENCCPGYIRNRSGRKCSQTSAPCYYDN